MSHVIRPIGRKYMQSRAIQHHLHTTSRLLALMPGKLFTLFSLQKNWWARALYPTNPSFSRPGILLVFPVCARSANAITAKMAAWCLPCTLRLPQPLLLLLLLGEGGRQLHNNDVLYNKQGVCRPFILSVALDDVVDAAKLITQH